MSIGVGERIKTIRKKSELTQAEFAAKIGITQTYLSYLETEKNPLSTKNTLAICRVFGVSEDWLLNGVGDMSAPDINDLPAWMQEFIQVYGKLDAEGRENIQRYADEKLELQRLREEMIPKDAPDEKSLTKDEIELIQVYRALPSGARPYLLKQAHDDLDREIDANRAHPPNNNMEQSPVTLSA
jgi:transcriptional regulator with XRE-family HTH domain